VNVYQADSEDPDNYDAANAIRAAATAGAKVVIMAWGMAQPRQAVTNEINYWYYNQDVMFVGAGRPREAWILLLQRPHAETGETANHCAASDLYGDGHREEEAIVAMRRVPCGKYAGNPRTQDRPRDNIGPFACASRG
jgi:hypothetical protein